MRQRLSDYRLFWREFRQNFRTTGAIAPSGRLLSRSLSRYVSGAVQGRRILEVGPGTGAVTREIVRRLHTDDRLDLVEVNELFVQRLRERFQQDAALSKVRDRVRILHQGVESLPADKPYDLIISGLPFNNFSVTDVEQVLRALMSLLRPGGTLSFFEYIGVRKAKSMFGSRREQARLRGIGRILRKALVAHEVRRDWVWPNLPPAWVHHLRQPEATTRATDEPPASVPGRIAGDEPLEVEPPVDPNAMNRADSPTSSRAGQGRGAQQYRSQSSPPGLRAKA